MDVLAWPIAVVLLGVLAMIMFRQPFVRLLDRTQKLTKDGLETGEQRASDQQKQLPVKTSEADLLLQGFENALLLKEEKNIQALLEERKITTPSERERVLVRFLASSVTQLEFERIYRIIFGSQIEALQLLNIRGACLVDDLDAVFTKAAAEFPDFYESFHFESWLGFLENQSFVSFQENNVSLTLKGHEFLKYLVAQGYNQARAF